MILLHGALSVESPRGFRLAGIASRIVGQLAHGQRQWVELGVVLSTDPDLVLLDEPAAGLNPSEKQEMATLLRILQSRLHLSLLLIEHDMELVMGLCDAVTVLDFGKYIASGPPRVVQSDPAVIAAYLGPDFVLSTSNDGS